jgi:transcriptional regulator with AAA-type ATPase domain
MLKIPHPDERYLNPLERLPEEVRRDLSSKGRIVNYTPGDSILRPGQGGDVIGILLSGVATVNLRDDEARDMSVDSLGPGDMFGEISFLTGAPSPMDSELIAEGPCETLEVDASDFQSILDEHPGFSVTLMRNLARKITRLDRKVVKSKVKRRALQSLISREEHIFPDYVIGDFVKQRLADKLHDLAHSDSPALIVGETGVGKEVLAHAIYRMGKRYKDVFLLLDLLRPVSEKAFQAEPVNGAGDDGASDDNDITKEQLVLFFGAEELGEDGALKEKPGYLELCEEGTLLVRGAERLTQTMQTRLLSAMETGVFHRFGGRAGQENRARIILTSELDEHDVDPERHPLIFALIDEAIVVPPLRKRRREIPTLVNHYVKKYGRELRKEIDDLPSETIKTLVNYNWPGNDVELSGTLKRAILVSEGGVIRPQDIYFDLKRVGAAGKFDLLSFKPVKKAVLSPLFPAILQSAVTPFFFILLLFLFLGPADPMRNPGALVSWAVGWPVLIIGSFIWARFWCALCPIGVISGLAKKVISLNKPFPAFLKTHSDFLLALAVIAIIWFETATGIRNSPFNVGLLLLAMLISAIIVSVIFERQSWCRYLCGLGGMIGLLSKASVVEMRADRNVCISHCNTNDCLLGRDGKEGCPFGQAGPRLHSNRLCKLCGACVKLCPHDAVRLRFRVPGQELWEIRHTNKGTAFLTLGMIGGLLTEMFSASDEYTRLTIWTGLPHIVKFSALFLIIVAGVNLLNLAAAAISRSVYGDRLSENYSRYGLALLPLALASFMAFHLYYLINLGVHLPILLSKTFDFELFRTMIIQVPQWVTFSIQQALIGLGFLWSAMVIYKLGRTGAESFWPAFRGVIPHWISAGILGLVVLEAMKTFFQSHPIM